MSDKLRQLWRAFFEEDERKFEAWQGTGLDHGEKPPPHPFPPELCGMTCEARTRKGTACKSRALFLNGRCKLHGGLSTGPKSEEGKRKAAQNAKKHQGEQPHESLQRVTFERNAKSHKT